MRLRKALLFALAVLVLCGLIATMMATHHIAEGFAAGDPTMADIAAARQQELAAMQKLMALPAFSPDVLAANKITDPVGSPENPNNGQMTLVKEFYAKNPTIKSPTPLSFRDQQRFNYLNLSPDYQVTFKKLGLLSTAPDNSLGVNPMAVNPMAVNPMFGGGPTPIEIRPDAPTSSWSRSGVQIISNVPQMCAPFVQQTMDADGNYFATRGPPNAQAPFLPGSVPAVSPTLKPSPTLIK